MDIYKTTFQVLVNRNHWLLGHSNTFFTHWIVGNAGSMVLCVQNIPEAQARSKIPSELQKCCSLNLTQDDVLFLIWITIKKAEKYKKGD